MDNAQKAITIGVGLFITIIVVAAVMTITGIGQDLLSSGQSQLSGLSGQLATSLTAQYAGQTMSGTQVKTAIQNYYNSTDLAVYLHVFKRSTVPVAAGGASGAWTIHTSPSGATANNNLIQCNQVRLSGSTSISFVFDEAVAKAARTASVSGVGFELDTGYATPLSTLVNEVNVTSYYRSFTVTNDDNGRTVALLFVRIQ